MTDNICKVAQLHDECDDTYYDVYEVDAIDGGRTRIEVPREVREPANVRKQLLKRGAEIPDLATVKSSLEAAIQSDAPLHVRPAAVGWYRDRFITRGGTVVGHDDGKVHLPRTLKASAADVGEHGLLSVWQYLIRIAAFSSTMIFCLCASFAAPLMRSLNCPSFAVVLVGESRLGKSFSQLVGGSVIGFGSEDHLPTPNATEAGLLETAGRYNDHTFFLNEIGAAKGRKSDKYAALQAMTYALTGSQDTIRHSVWSGVTIANFRTIIVMSSEVSPDEWAARGGDMRDPGETVRLIGMPVLHDQHPTVFDLFSGTPEEELQYLYDQSGQLRADLPEQRGVALRVFLEALMTERATFYAHAQEDVEDFRLCLKEYATTPIARDIIGKFAVIYAGGYAACDAKVLPFHSNAVYAAVRRSCIAALKALPEPEADLRRDRLILRDLLTGAGILDNDEASTRQKRNLEKMDGYFEREGVGRRYTVRTTSFCKAFSTTIRARRLLEWLDCEGNLQHQRGRKIGLSLEWAQCQATWPNAQRVRSFVIYFPTGLKVLEKA